jgi:hypothetical protein
VQDQLKLVLEQLVREVATVYPHLSKDDGPLRPLLVNESARTDKLKLVEHMEPRFDRGFLIKAIAPSRLPTWARASQVARADHRLTQVDGKTIWIGNTGVPVQPAAVPGEFLLDYLMSSQTVAFNAGLFDARYAAMIDHHNPAEPVRICLRCPLVGFTMVPSRAKLDASTTIRRLTPGQVTSIINRHPQISFHHGQHQGWFRYILDVSVRSEKFTSEGDDAKELISIGSGSIRHASVVNREILTLRSLTRQTPSAGTFVEEMDEWPLGSYASLIAELPWSLRGSRRADLPDPLSAAQVRKYRELRKRFLALDRGRTGYINAAARRIAFAPDGAYAGDRLADYVSALEALVMRHESYQGEIMYRFGHRVAVLTAARGDRARISKLARDLYDMRSKVVHGEAIPDDHGFGTLFLDEQPRRRKRSIKVGSIGELERQARDIAKTALVETMRQTDPVDWDRLVLSER